MVVSALVIKNHVAYNGKEMSVAPKDVVHVLSPRDPDADPETPSPPR